MLPQGRSESELEQHKTSNQRTAGTCSYENSINDSRNCQKMRPYRRGRAHEFAVHWNMQPEFQHGSVMEALGGTIFWDFVTSTPRASTACLQRRGSHLHLQVPILNGFLIGSHRQLVRHPSEGKSRNADRWFPDCAPRLQTVCSVKHALGPSE